MATYTWTGAGSTQFTGPENWTPTPGANGPTAADDAVFNGSALRDCTSPLGRTLKAVTLTPEFRHIFTWGGTLELVGGAPSLVAGAMDPLLDSATLLVSGVATLRVEARVFAFTPEFGAAALRVTDLGELITARDGPVEVGSHIFVDGGRFFGRALWLIACPEVILGRGAGASVFDGRITFLAENDDAPDDKTVKKSTGEQTITVGTGGTLTVPLTVSATLEMPLLVTGGLVVLQEDDGGGFQPHLEVKGNLTGYTGSFVMLSGFLRVGPDRLDAVGSPLQSAGPRTLTAEHGFYVGAQASVFFRTTSVTSRGAWKVDGFVSLVRCGWTCTGDVDLRGGGTLIFHLRALKSSGQLFTLGGNVYLDNAWIQIDSTGHEFKRGHRFAIISTGTAGTRLIGRPRAVIFTPDDQRWTWELTDRTLILIYLGSALEISPIEVRGFNPPREGGRRLAGTGEVGEGG